MRRAGPDMNCTCTYQEIFFWPYFRPLKNATRPHIVIIPRGQLPGSDLTPSISDALTVPSFLLFPCDNLSLVVWRALKYCRPMNHRSYIKRFGTLLALMAVLANFSLPLTHGQAANPDDGYVEICTTVGIKLVSVATLDDKSDPAAHEDNECSACITCPICQIQSVKYDLSILPAEYADLSILASAPAFNAFGREHQRQPHFIKPENRAPPVI